MGRRRPRRQSQRDRRVAGDRAEDAGRSGLAFLSRRSASARRGAFDLAQIRRRHQSAGGAGQPRGRRQSAPRRRTLPPRADRRLLAPRRHAGAFDRRAGGAARGGAGRGLRQQLGLSRRSRHDRRVAAAAPQRGDRLAAPGALDSRGGGVRLPPRHRRSAPKLRPSRGDDHGNSGAGARRRQLRGAPRAGEATAVAAAAVGSAPGSAAGREIFASRRGRTGDLRQGRRDARELWRRVRSAITSSATPRPSAIFWKCCCCKRKAA